MTDTTAETKFTLQLSSPIGFEDKSWSALTLVEPLLSHRMAAEKKQTPTETVIALISQLSSVPEPAVRKLKGQDAKRINKWLDTVEPNLKTLPGPAEGETQKVFTLSRPILVDGQPRTSLTVREPDLEVNITLEKLTGRYLQMAGAIAGLSGLTIPVIGQLAMRDALAIEAWIIPFVADTE